MPIIRDDAVVLARLDYSETSQILVLLTREHGKVRAIAKGIKRGTKARFAVGIDLLEVGSALLSSRQERGESLALLTEWKQTRAHSGLREKLPRMNAAQYVAEITARLTEDWDPAPRLFDGLMTALEVLAGSDEPIGPTVNYQQLLLYEIGSAPRFDACVLCGRNDQLTHFSSFEGGMVCRHCEPHQVEKRQVSAATLAWVRTGPDERIGPVPTAQPPVGAFSLLNYHLSHLMGREPVMAARLVPKVLQRRIDPAR